MARRDVFISYARADAADAFPIAEGFRKAGLTVWLDETEIEVRNQPMFSASISTGLLESQILAVVCSKNVNESTWVDKELQLFILTSRKDSVPTRICFITLDSEVADDLETRARNFGRAAKGNLDISKVRPADLETLAAQLSSEIKAHAANAQVESKDDWPARVQAAREFWDRKNIMRRAGWGEPDFDSLLKRFDALGPIYDACWQREEETADPDIRRVLESMILGEMRIRIANNAGQEILVSLTGEELRSLPYNGNHLDVLASMSLDGNIIADLQATYYVVRQSKEYKSTIRDAFDLTVILAIGFCIDRWVRIRPSLPRVVDAILAQRHLA